MGAGGPRPGQRKWGGRIGTLERLAGIRIVSEILTGRLAQVPNLSLVILGSSGHCGIFVGGAFFAVAPPARPFEGPNKADFAPPASRWCPRFDASRIVEEGDRLRLYPPLRRFFVARRASQLLADLATSSRARTRLGLYEVADQVAVDARARFCTPSCSARSDLAPYRDFQRRPFCRGG